MSAVTENNPFSRFPLMKVIIPAAVGIIIGYWVAAPVWAAAACCVICAAVSLSLGSRRYGGIYLWLAVLLFFFGLSQASRPRSELPAGERIALVAQISETPNVRGRWQVTTASVGYWKPAPHGDSHPSREWIRVDERIMLNIDTCYHDMEVGRQLIFRGWFNPIDTTGSSYGNLMRMRGLHGRMYLVPGNLLERGERVSKTPAYYASRLQAASIERLRRLDMPEDRRAIVAAMTAGDKRAIDRQLRAGYSSTGAAHILAVSGLHVGIVFVLINLLLFMMPAAPRGHILRNIAAIVAIWLFAAMAGLSPSVVRAALMFSFVQIALATTSYRNGINIMLGSAVVMLAVNPNYAADPSFLLSYVAVCSIFVFFNPLYSLVRTRFRAVNALLAILIIGLVASLGVAPLVSYWFGNFPVAGLLLNPVTTVTAHIIVMAGVLWVAMPFDFLEPAFSAVLNFSAGVQNSAVEWGAARSWSSLEVRLPLWAVLTIYAGYIILAVVLSGRGRDRRKRLSLPK